MKLTHTLPLLATCLACMSASAQWQWLDKDGHRVFSDRAPSAEIPAKNILKQPGQPIHAPDAAELPAPSQVQSASSAPQISKIDKTLEAKKKQAQEEQVAKQKEEQARITKAKVENCERAKHAKATLDSGIRINRLNAAGENEVMNEAARAQEFKRIQTIMAADCT